MKEVTIREVKQHLSRYITAASGGEPILITKHGRPVAMLDEADRRHVHVGSHSGRARLRPAMRRATGGRFLEVLMEDRHGGIR